MKNRSIHSARKKQQGEGKQASILSLRFLPTYRPSREEASNRKDGNKASTASKKPGAKTASLQTNSLATPSSIPTKPTAKTAGSNKKPLTTASSASLSHSTATTQAKPSEKNTKKAASSCHKPVLASTAGGLLAGAAGGAGGAVVGSFIVPGAGTVIGGIVGGVIGSGLGAVGTSVTLNQLQHRTETQAQNNQALPVEKTALPPGASGETSTPLAIRVCLEKQNDTTHLSEDKTQAWKTELALSNERLETMDKKDQAWAKRWEERNQEWQLILKESDRKWETKFQEIEEKNQFLKNKITSHKIKNSQLKAEIEGKTVEITKLTNQLESSEKQIQEQKNLLCLNNEEIEKLKNEVAELKTKLKQTAIEAANYLALYRQSIASCKERENENEKLLTTLEKILRGEADSNINILATGTAANITRFSSIISPTRSSTATHAESMENSQAVNNNL